MVFNSPETETTTMQQYTNKKQQYLVNSRPHLNVSFLRLIFMFSTVSFILFSCSTYKQKSELFQGHLQMGKTEEALKDLDKNRFLKRQRNQLLYYMEKGRVAFLAQDYNLSNTMLNKADYLIEEGKKGLGNEALSRVTNPERTTYKGEDFEKVLTHYYKALNYSYLKKYDDAIVEAKRINLSLQNINSKYPPDKKNRYNNDAFSLILQALLYEASGDINNAFISYRNAADLFIKNKNEFLGTLIPLQLKKDLLRTAKHMGFTNEYERYASIFNLTADLNKPEGGDLILFWETGLAPYKDQNMYAFTILPGKTDGLFTVYNEELNLTLPLPLDLNNSKTGDLSDLSIFNIAFPKYVKRQPFFNKAQVMSDNKLYKMELVENVEEIAFLTLENRLFREVGSAALRLATKKLMEYTVRKENEYAGLALGLLNTITERADTRNWQSLPNKIYYCRIPLKKGDNTITLQKIAVNGTAQESVLHVKGTGHMQFKSISTLKSLN